MANLAESELRARSLHERKAVLRAAVMAERDARSPSERRARSDDIVALVTALPGYRDAGRILLTSSFGSEVDTGPLIAHTLAAGKMLLLPRVNKTARMLELYQVEDPSLQLARGTYGIAEPRSERCRRASYDEVDWVLVPGVVYADDGFRIGYGGGYYDRLLPLLRPGTPRVSAAFSFQRRAQVPHGVHDQKIDLIVTDAGPYAVP